MRNGIDVSHWQAERGAIDWQTVRKQGYDFVIMKAAQGSTNGRVYADPKFVQNIRGAAAAGFDIGVYLFSGAFTEAAARKEAENLVRLLEPYRAMITWPVSYDIEKEAQGTKARRTTNTAQAKAFCEVIRQAGYRPMLYVNPAWAAAYIDAPAVGVDIWLAHYTHVPGKTSYKGAHTIHQYTDKAQVSGIKADKVDLDIAVFDYSQQEDETEELGMIYHKIEDIPAGEMRATIKHLVDNGWLKGNEKGDLDLPYQIARQYVVNARAGVYGKIKL